MRIKVKSDKSIPTLVEEINRLTKPMTTKELWYALEGYRKVPMRRVIDLGYVSDGYDCVEPDYEIKKY